MWYHHAFMHQQNCFPVFVMEIPSYHSQLTKVRDLGVVLLPASFLIIILVVFVSLLIFNCVASEEFETS